MNVLRFFQRRSAAPAKRSSSPEPTRSASTARDWLTILLAHEHTVIGRSKLVEVLREEILAVIAKHIPVQREQAQVKMARGDSVSTLEVDIEIPTGSGAVLAISS